MAISKKILAVSFGKKIACKSPLNNRYSAILIYRNRIISYAHNSFKSFAIRNNSKYCIL